MNNKEEISSWHSILYLQNEILFTKDRLSSRYYRHIESQSYLFYTISLLIIQTQLW